MAKNASKIIIRNKQIAVEAIVRSDRTGLRRALRKMYRKCLQGLYTDFSQTVDHGGIGRQQRRDDAAGEADEERDHQAQNGNLPGHEEHGQKARGVLGHVDEVA